MSSQTDPPRVFTRLRVVVSLLSGLRGRDFRSAVRFMNVRYAGDPLAVRFLKSCRWALAVMWRDIPESSSWVTVDRSISSTPYWLTATNPLEDHPWRENPQTQLPDRAAVVVVGAGFGGASVAYHWSKQGTEPMVVLERGQAASGAAGRNGGIVVMAGGHLHGYDMYEQVMRYVAANQPRLSPADRDELAGRFTDAYVKALHASHESIKRTIEAEQIDCDYVRRGWVFFTDRIAKDDLEASLALAERRGHADWVRRTPEEVRERSGARSTLDGAESLGGATWHPAKWVWGILGEALRNQKVELFTRTTVRAVERDGDEYIVRTDRGTIRAGNVVNATESYTPVLFKSFLAPFPDLITPYKEQGMHAEGGPASMAKQVGVSGPLGFSTRVAGGGIVFGSDHTPLARHQAGMNKPSRFVTRFRCASIGKDWEPSAMRVTHEWTGTTSGTPDKYPVIGRMDDLGLYIIGGFAGAGSAVSFNAGKTIVDQVLGNSPEPNYHPEEFFSPMRFTDPRRYGRRDFGRPVA